MRYNENESLSKHINVRTDDVGFLSYRNTSAAGADGQYVRMNKWWPFSRQVRTRVRFFLLYTPFVVQTTIVCRGYIRLVIYIVYIHIYYTYTINRIQVRHRLTYRTGGLFCEEKKLSNSKLYTYTRRAYKKRGGPKGTRLGNNIIDSLYEGRLVYVSFW